MSNERKYPIVKYNEAGLEVYREEANGYWVKREYDEANRQIYWETNRGGWAKHQYDEAGNETYYENSDGFWFKAEYDQNGFRTYYEDSNGKVKGTKGVDAMLADAVERSDGSVFNKEKADEFVKE